ncbi:MAG: endonuclease [Bacteroidales bacterium]
MKKLIYLLPLLFCFESFAQIPSGYYDSAAGLTGEELKTALHNIIDNHTTYPYTDSSTDVWDILKESDKDPNNSANVILIYTGWTVNAAQEYNNGAGWSREHVWAKSHGDFDEDPPAGTDCHHLRPEDISVNSARGDKDFDNGGTQHYEATECYTDADSWEPRPAVKGDVARMMFYMATRYEGDVVGEPDLELVNYTGTSGPIFGKLETLIEWNEQDPVDDFERNRNEVVYSYQHNRNPFIDHPEWVGFIWGNDSVNTDVNSLVNEKVKIFPNPVRDNLTIEIPDNYDVVSIVLFDLMGREIQTLPVNSNLGTYIINLSDKTAGNYVLKIRTQQNCITKMIIVN